MAVLSNSAFGRRVKVTIYTYDNLEGYVFESSFAQGLRGLKISGEVKQYFVAQPPEATVNIYNLSAIEAANIMNLKYKIVEDTTVECQLRIKIEAGYDYGYFGEIFDGEVLKPNMMKPDAVNTILRLTCIDGAGFYSAGSTLTQTFQDGMNYYSVAQQIQSNSDVDYDIVLSDTLKNITVDGSFVTSNTDYLTFTELAEETDTYVSVNGGTIYIQTLDEMIYGESIATVLTSKTGLIGIPALTNDGVTIQSILNHNIQPLSLIQLDNSDISIDQPEYLSSREIGAWLASDGLYRAIEVQHQFDTTTGTFCTNISALSRDYYDYLS